MRHALCLALLVVLVTPSAAQTDATAARLTDAQIKQGIIKLSIASYAGSCPCPYHTDRAGRSCGRRSAYSKPGGKAPLCYPGEVTKAMISEYRVKLAEKRPEPAAVEANDTKKP